jgi:phage N-6-adenine-methyltransferase
MANDSWETPPLLFKRLEEHFGKFDVDLAASDSNHLCDEYYTIEDSALDKYWNEKRGYLNCPYSNINPWVKKAIQTAEDSFWDRDCYDTDVIMLLPQTFGTKIWHEWVFPNHDCVDAIYLIKGRIKFTIDGVPQGTPRFDSCVVHFNYSSSRRGINFYTCDREFKNIMSISD